MTDAWDKFVDGAREVVNSVADVAGGLYEKGKDYVNVKRLQGQLRDSYRQLGRIQYQIETGVAVEKKDKADLIEAITALREELKKTDEEEMKYEFVACKSCGELIASDAKFCSNCGAKTEPQTATEE